MNIEDEIMSFVKDNEPVPQIDIISHISYKYPNMVRSFITRLTNKGLLFLDMNNCITSENYETSEKRAIIYLLNNDRKGKKYLINNCSPYVCCVVKRFIFNNYLKNVSTNNWTLNPIYSKELFHDIMGFTIEESKILGKRLSEYKKIYKYGEFVFED